MGTRSKVVAIAIVTGLLVSLVPLAAQTSATAGGSLTGDVTNSLFKEDRDNYLNTTDWSKVEKNVIFVDFGKPTNNAFPFDIGTGFILGKAFVGIGYTQSMVDNKNQTTSLDETVNYAVPVITGYETTKTYSMTGNDHNATYGITGLFGIGFIGVRNEFKYTINETQRYYDPTTFNGNYTATQGTEVVKKTGDTVTSEINTVFAASKKDSSTWYDRAGVGLNLLPDLSLKVAASALVQYYANGGYAGVSKEVTKRDPTATAYPTYNGKAGVYYYSKETSAYAPSYLEITPSANASVKLKMGDVFSLTPYLGYGMVLRLFSNKYVDLGGGEKTVEGVAYDTYKKEYTLGTTLNTLANKFDDTRVETWNAYTDVKSYMQNQIAPALTLNADFSERFSFAAKVTPMFTLTSEASKSQMNSRTVTTYDDGAGATGVGSYVQTANTLGQVTDVKTERMSINNKLEVGAKFFMIPKKLRINLGTTVSNDLGSWQTQTTSKIGVGRTTTVKDWGAADKVDTTTYSPNSTITITEASKQVYTSTGSITTVYETGLTWFYDDNLSMDLKSAGGDIWNLNNWTLQLNIRY